MKSKRAELKKFVVPATIMLSFISFWRAAAIVLCDLGSSAYYVGGIAEKSIGKAAPWFILGIMLFSYAVRAVYIESCSMFVRGGVYRVVREAMGGTAAKFSVSALLFDYVLTGPVSAVSAGLYLAALINELGGHFHFFWLHVPVRMFATGFAILVTLYFWHTNRVGIPFSSTRALRIMQITTVMVALLIGWCLLTIFSKGYQTVPWPTMTNLQFSDETLGWLKGSVAPGITFVAVLIGFGHSLLAMSGEESLAQVNREIEAPKQKNLILAGLIIFVYTLLFTSLVSFFAIMIIPDAERSRYFDNLIAGVSMFLVGPVALRLAFHTFVVLVGVLILSGAVNTALVGSNGVLNRVAEDRILPVWFREPHQKHGTTHRIINLIVGLQLATILISRGDIYLLGEAYAFGVVWSFTMIALAVVVLRFKEPDVPRWRVPINFRAVGIEWPVGLIFTTTLLFLLASINVLTKKIATIAGASFTVVFFIAFTICERYYKPREKEVHRERRFGRREEVEEERFRLQVREHLSPKSLSVRPGNILIAVSEPDKLWHLQKVLEENDPKKCDIVVLSVNPNAPQEVRKSRMGAERVMDERETRIFSNVVYVTEKVGKPVSLVAVPGNDPYGLILQAAQKLRSSRVVVSRSSLIGPDEQARNIREAWKQLGRPQPELLVEVIPDDDGGERVEIHLPPRLSKRSAAEE